MENFFSQVYPFNILPEDELNYLYNNIIKKKYKKDDIIFKESTEPLEYLYIIEKGSVSLEADNQIIETLKEAGIFGFISLLGDQPPTSTARVLEEPTIVWLVPKQDFLRLCNEYNDFALYFTKKLSNRISKFSTSRSFFDVEGLIDVKIKDLKLKEPLIVEHNKNLLDAIKLMAEKDSTYCIIKRDSDYGIITERDVIKKVLAKDLEPKKMTVQEIATFPIIKMSSSDLLFNALLTMAKHNIRKLIISEGDQIVGVLDDRTIISHQSKNVLFLIKEIDKAKSIEDLSYLYSMIQDSLIEISSRGMDPEYMGKYISELNDYFMKKTAKLTEALLGKSPSDYMILVIGSEGRKEQSLKTDQDNVLLYESDENNYFENFAKTYIDNLLKIGFPPCPGNVMISNPYWRKSKLDWFKEIEKWMENPKPENVLNISIFFDFRMVFGSEYLYEELKEFVKKSIKTSKTFLPFLASEAVKFKPPLNLFKQLVVEKSGENRGKIDIKKHGIFPIVQGIRVLSLENEIFETNTYERIKILSTRNVFGEKFAKDLEDTYRFLMNIRLKSQANQLYLGKEPSNFIDPETLSKTEHNLLRDAFKVIEEFQDFLYEKYNLRYFAQ